jgi:hypothetical protein
MTRKTKNPVAPKRGGKTGNGNALRGTEPRVQFNATADTGVAWVAETLDLSNGRMIDALADAASALAHSAFQVEDGGWYARWIDAYGEMQETENTAPTERAARILAGIACAAARAALLD